MQRRNVLRSFVVMSDNVRGIKSKLNSIHDILLEEKPGIIGLTETKLQKEDVIDMEGYIVKRVDRKKGKDGGGVLIAYKEEFEHIMKVAREEDENVEMLWMKLESGETKARIGIVYMPQEDENTVNELKVIYKMIEEEIESAVTRNEKVILLGDFNCKVGVAIPGNVEKITKGGRLLLKLVKKYNLCILNGEKVCEGLWTRIEGEEKSVIDYAIIREEDRELVSQMVIDERKDFTPYTVENNGGDVRFVHSDHCMLKIKCNMYVKGTPDNSTKRRLDRKKCEEYAEELRKKKVSEMISEKDFQESYSSWCEQVMQIRDRHSTCKKQKKKMGKCNRLLLRKKREITKQLRSSGIDRETVKTLKKRKQLVMEHMEHERVMERKRKIEATVQEVEEGGGVGSATFWKVKDRLMKRTKHEVAAIMDENGEKQEDEEKIKKVYMNYFQDLLTTNAGTTEEEEKWEGVVADTIKKMEAISKNTTEQISSEEDVEEIVKNLAIRKAPDRDTWSNEMIVRGGKEMIKSLSKIFKIIDKEIKIPAEWNRMAIRTLNKKGSKLVMGNKRGLFLTNIISKIYERVVKRRNEESMKENRSSWQMGGEKGRSCTDNLFITYSVIERNKYLGKPTYVFFADAEKCFDKLWLDDSIIELWRKGTNVRDALVIREMNKKANILIHTPVGDTEDILCENIVRQGTVYGPQLCGVSTGRVNSVGREIATMYGPNLIIQSTQFVDDIESAGSPRVTNNTIYNCRILEERKKMKFNNKNGKTEYLIVNPPKYPETITSEVKNGKVMRAKEHKYVGHWIDEKGTYGINIEKNKERIPLMISSVAAIGNGEMGTLAVQTRLKLLDVVIMKSLLHDIEVLPTVTCSELKELEKIQHNVLTGLLNMPKSTPYVGLLMETGLWTIQARIEYRKLMLFHNIKNSDEDRIIKQILTVQESEARGSTWFADVCRILCKYEIELNVSECLKSTWKKQVKEKISIKVEEEIREKCEELTKTRLLKKDEYKMKQYLQECSLTESTDIMKSRMHMVKLPCNYGLHRDKCPLCGQSGKIVTEHYFEQCQMTRRMAGIWKTNCEHLGGSIDCMKKAKNHLKKVEILMEQYMSKP